MSHPHTSGILAAQLPRCGEKARKNARWNFVDLNVLEIPGNPEILDKNFRKSGNLCQICTKSRNPGQFFLGFPKSGKSRTLFWVVKCPSLPGVAKRGLGGYSPNQKGKKTTFRIFLAVMVPCKLYFSPLVGRVSPVGKILAWRHP